MRTLLKILLPLGIGIAFLMIVLAFSGCTTVRPDYYDAALVHQSHAMAGPGPEPVGGPRDESTLNGVEGAVGWERGRYFGEAGLMYAMRERNVVGGPWVGTFRFGVRIRPNQSAFLPGEIEFMESQSRGADEKAKRDGLNAMMGGAHDCN